MKVIESQTAVLSNYEVYQHLVDQRQRYKSKKRRGPPNLENVVQELLQYLQAAPGPLSQEPTTYTPESIAQLLERLRPFDLSKGEVVMILNVRPASVIGLNTVVEEMSERFTDEQQLEMVYIIADVLGKFETAEPDEGHDEAAEGGDVNMDDAAA
ncbi:RNA polymerase III, subunit C17 [Purpureocillium lilacinum]|uniref:DNA-directed RNA polymerase III subunit RPC9 n=2 Tax=Purpureocillium lilacinum TaxID=33203 RepID=A0A179HF86_PURLI|nr:RNA polymerase III, subunit C17 [Purpureocillium lilacinum]OAQ88288.1 RNA polymerase III, subunit C17 [Purpureocillium lilacinum]